MALYGEGGTPDYPQAMGWLNDAAFKGSPEAQYVLGYLFEVGIKDAENKWAVEPNPERAMSMYALAAFNKYPEGMVGVGLNINHLIQHKISWFCLLSQRVKWCSICKKIRIFLW